MGRTRRLCTIVRRWKDEWNYLSELARVCLGFGSDMTRVGSERGVQCKVYEKAILLQRHYSAIGRIYPCGSGYGRLWDPAVRLDQEASFQPIEVLDAKLFEWRRDSVFFGICGVRSYQRPVKRRKIQNLNGTEAIIWSRPFFVVPLHSLTLRLGTTRDHVAHMNPRLTLCSPHRKQQKLGLRWGPQ